MTPEEQAKQDEETAILNARLAEQKAKEESGLSEANAFAGVDPTSLPSNLPPAELKPQPLPRVMTERNLADLSGAGQLGPALVPRSDIPAPQPAAAPAPAAPTGYSVVSVAVNEFKVTHNGIDLEGKVLNPVEAGAVLSWLRSLPS